MIIGNPERFAIEVEVVERIDDWLFGHIRFWICGHPVGNWADSADLLGCLRWLKDFRDHPRNRYEPGFFELPPCEVFHHVFDEEMDSNRPHESLTIRNEYLRFHISHLGMSSFDRFDLLLLTNEHGAERCLWREAGNDEIHDCRLWRNEMESVAGEFCERLERAIAETPP